VKQDGTLWAWGWNNNGQLGDGTRVNKNNPVQIGTATNWKTVAANQYHTLAVKQDGTLWAWGRNNYGQLGDGTAWKESPFQIDLPLITWIVTPSAGIGGTISPNTPQSVKHGSIASFTVTPNAGYGIDTVTGCGGSGSGSTYTTGAITADCAVTASFQETDNDNDGIGDAWEMRYFGDLTTAGTDTNFDKDGYSDKQEYLNWLTGQNDPQGAAYDPTVKNAPGGTGCTGASFLPAIKLLLPH
jgi:hypothetical protein